MRTRTVAHLGVLVCIWTFAVMMLGGYTSAIGAGLSCPDWPTCYGQWFPPFPSAETDGIDPETGQAVGYTHHQIMAEWVHRLVASLLGPFLIAFSILTWRQRMLPDAARYLPFAGTGVLFVQYILGGLTVLHLSDPVLVTTHLGTATAFMVMMVIPTVLLYMHSKDDRAHRGDGGTASESDDHATESPHTSTETPTTTPTSTTPTTPPTPSTSISPSAKHSAHSIPAPDAHAHKTLPKRRADGVWHDPVLPQDPPLQAAPEPLATGGGASGHAQPVEAFGVPAPSTRTTTGASFGDYLAMTKPRVMFLLVLTSLAAMFIATGGVPSLMPALGVILGGAMATGGAGAINHFLERDLDTRMARTQNRPVASGRILPAQALTFGITLGVLSFIVTWQLANLLAALFAICGLLFYVFIYTMWLKRTTYLNIVIGGAAGGFPALVGWAAATNSLGLGAWLLFALIVVWTPPHFWALALVLREDYAKANVPMLPVVKGIPRTTREILIYSVVTVGLSFAFFTFDILGRLFLISASLLGGLLLVFAIHLHLEPTKKVARALFGYSIIYLGLLYLVAFIDVLVL